MRTKKLFFFVVCLILGLNINAQDDYLRVTELSQIQNGSSIILAARHDSLSTTAYYAMPNEAAGKPLGVAFTTTMSDEGVILPSEITDNELNFCWTVGVTNGNYTFINPSGDMIGYGTNGTDFVKNGANSTWAISAATSGSGTSVPNHNAYVITNVGASNRSIAFRKYSSGDVYEKFAPYSNSETNMGGNIYFFYIDIFVKSSEITPMVSLPTFSPSGGDYSTTQNVAISCETQGATIYYTTDGSAPTNESSIYSNPIEVSTTTTIKAVAMKDGMMNSGVATATYNIIESVVVSFYVNGVMSETMTLAKGDEIGELPIAVAPGGFSFSGWMENEIQGFVNQSPTMVVPSYKVNENKNLYAVFSVSDNNCVESELSSLNGSDAVVISISKDGKYYAMSQIEGGSGQPTAYAITVTDGRIVSAVPDDIKWNIAYNNGNMVVYPNGNEDNWLYCTSGSNNNAVRIGTNADNNIFELKTVQINEEVYPDYLYNKTTERFVGAYYDGDIALDWRAYKLTASGAFPTNIKNQTYHFFKYEGVSSYCTKVEVPSAQTIASNTTWNDNVSVINKVTIENGAVLTVNGLIACANAENLIVKDGGQLIHNNAGLNANLEKEIEGYGNTNGAWYTISSPLKGSVDVSKVEGLMPTSNKYDLYRYDEPTSAWQNVKDGANNFTTMDSGRGYLYANEYDCTLSFEGHLNNADVSYNLSKTNDVELSGFNLIGNPFAHNIYKGKGAAIDDNNLAEGYYTLSNSGAWNAKMSDATAIKPCQGILVKTIKAGELKIKKTNAVPSQKSGDNESLAIKVSNGDYEDIAYVSFADKVGLEKIRHQNEDIPMIYVSVDSKDYAIAMVESSIKDIPLSFEAKIMGEYTLSVSSMAKQFDDVYLVDKQTGDVTNMLMEDYTFIATSNDNHERFELKLYEYDTVEDLYDDNDFVYVDKSELIIRDITSNTMIQVFDMVGHEILRRENCTEKVERISTDGLMSGIYIVRMVGDAGVRTQKVVIHKF